MTAEWLDPSGQKNPIKSTDIKKTTDKDAIVQLVPGMKKGQGTLTLISANNLRASSPVQVT